MLSLGPFRVGWKGYLYCLGMVPIFSKTCKALAQFVRDVMGLNKNRERLAASYACVRMVSPEQTAHLGVITNRILPPADALIYALPSAVIQS